MMGLGGGISGFATEHPAVATTATRVPRTQRWRTEARFGTRLTGASERVFPIDSLDTSWSLVRNWGKLEPCNPWNLDVQSTLTDDTREFRAPHTMTPSELGDNLARLVWESFSDFVSQEDVETPLPDIDTLYDDDGSAHRTTEEALIFFMWAHTRGAQLAFLRRAPDELIRQGLDAMHRAVFEDMVEHGTPEAQIPLFEQRVSTRYAEYHQAASESDTRLGQAVSRHLTTGGAQREGLIDAIRERAVAVANPLRDFLEDVELVED